MAGKKVKFYGAFSKREDAERRAKGLKNASVKSMTVRGKRRYGVMQRNPYIAVVNPPSKRKRVEHYVVEGNYGSRWEVVVYGENKKDALELLKDYRNNEPYARFRITKKPYNMNPKEMRPRIKVIKSRKRGTLGKRSPLKGFQINAPKLIYGKVLEIRAEKTNGSYKGKRFKHSFDSTVKAYGNSDGSVTLRGSKPIWMEE